MASATGIPAVVAPKAPATPIEPLNTDAARIYTHIHPILVLSLYAYKFNDVVANPVPALLGTLLPLAVLQIAYVAVCLPPTSGTGSTPQIKKQKLGEKKKVALGGIEKGINGTIVVRQDIAYTFGSSLRVPVLIHCTAGIPLPPPHSHSLDAPRHRNARPVRRSGDNAPHAHPFGRRAHGGAEHAAISLRTRSQRRDMERGCGALAAD